MTLNGLFALGMLAAIALLPRIVARLRGAAEHRWIEVDELVRLLGEKRPVTVIDVRGPSDFTGPLSHIASARNLPLAEVERRLPELAPWKREPIVLVCRTHKMSASAAAQLGAAGFRDVRVLHGGMVKWNEHGLPVADRPTKASDGEAVVRR